MKEMDKRMRNRSMNVCMERMHECCCRQTMTMKGSVCIIIGQQRIKQHEYEKDSISNSSYIEYQLQHYLG